MSPNRVFARAAVGALVVGALGLVMVAPWFDERTAEAAEPRRAASPKRPAIQRRPLKTTVVVAHPGQAVPAQNNIVYCATFQLAWNELQDGILKEPIRLEGEPAFVELLNGQQFRKTDLAGGSYIALAGRVGDGIVEKIQQALVKAFPNATVKVPSPEGPDTIVSFAYLEKSIEFLAPYDVLPEPLTFHGASGPVRVRSFGIEEEKRNHEVTIRQRKQIKVLNYRTADDFALSLICVPDSDELVLAKGPFQKTLDETLQRVQESAQSKKKPGFRAEVQAHEPINIPELAFETQHDFTELIGRHFENAEWKKYFIGAARQGIRFRLNEKGAKLESSAKIMAPAAEAEDDNQPRSFVFNKPFLLTLKERTSKRPYFALWVETPEVLLPSETTPVPRGQHEPTRP